MQMQAHPLERALGAIHVVVLQRHLRLHIELSRRDLQQRVHRRRRVSVRVCVQVGICLCMHARTHA